MLYLTLFAIFDLVVLALGWYYYTVNRVKQQSTNVVDVPGLKPLLGHSLVLAGDGVTRQWVDAIQDFYDFARKNGDKPTRYFVGTGAHLVVSHLNDIAAVVKQTNTRGTTECAVINELFNTRSMLVALQPKPNHEGPDGVGGATISPWKRHRALLTHAFSARALNKMSWSVTTVAQRVCGAWSDALAAKKSDTMVVDMLASVHAASLDIIGLAALGVDFDTSGEARVLTGGATSVPATKTNEISRAARRVLQVAEYRLFNLPTWKIFGDRQTDRDVALLRAEGLKAVEARRANPRDVTGSGNIDLVDLMLASEDDSLPDGKRLTDSEVVDGALQFLLAGSETTANTLSYALFEIARHQDLQDEIRAEIHDVCGDSTPTFAQSEKLDLVVRTAKETLRLYPTAAAFGRAPADELVLPTNNTKVERDGVDSIFMPIRAVHRDSEYYERPLEFLPERWVEGSPLVKNHAAYFPFGGGRRVCIGKSLAYAELHVVLAAIVQRFAISLLPGYELREKHSLTSFPIDLPIVVKML